MKPAGTFCNKHMLIAQVCVKFRWRIARQSFLENNFVYFSDVVRVKKNQDFSRWWCLELEISPNA